MAFRDIVGHEQVKYLLQQTLRRSEFAHAYLFVGPAGVGKRLTALTFSKAICCSEAEADCCDRCATCRRIDQGVYPDLTLVEPQDQTMKIDQVREIRQLVSLRPFEGVWKMVILDGAERMTKEAANALLKILEEPPGTALFFLLSTHLKALLPTVISRCQVLRFSPLSSELVGTFLREKRGLSSEEADLLASFAQGSLGWALTVDREALLHRREIALRVLEVTLDGTTEEIFVLAEQHFQDREEAKLICEHLLSLCRDLSLLQVENTSALLIHWGIQQRLQRLAQLLTLDTSLTLFDVVFRTLQMLDGYVNPQLAIESMMMEMKQCRAEGLLLTL